MIKKTGIRTENGFREIVLDMSIREVYELFLQRCSAKRMQPSTMQYYQYFLPKYVNWLEENGVTSLEEAAQTETIDAFITVIGKQHAYGKEKEYSDNTVHIYARTIRTMIRFAYERGYLKRLPTFNMPIVHKTKLCVLNEDQIEKLLRVCESTRDMAIVLVAIASGMRRGELADLKWKDVNFDESSIEVLEGKGKKFRTVMLDRATAKLLMQYKAELGSQASPGATLFQNREGLGLADEGYRALFSRLSARSGIKFSAHALRRTFAKLCLKRGMDVIYIQNLMGHSNIETTAHYIQQLDDEDVREAYEEHTPIQDLARKTLKRRRK